LSLFPTASFFLVLRQPLPLFLFFKYFTEFFFPCSRSIRFDREWRPGWALPWPVLSTPPLHGFHLVPTPGLRKSPHIDRRFPTVPPPKFLFSAPISCRPCWASGRLELHHRVPDGGFCAVWLRLSYIEVVVLALVLEPRTPPTRLLCTVLRVGFLFRNRRSPFPFPQWTRFAQTPLSRRVLSPLLVMPLGVFGACSHPGGL